jgi:hypothetical protein
LKRILYTMSDVMEAYPHLNELTVPQIHARYQELKGDGNGANLPDETLRELLALARILRKRSAAPSARKTSSKTVPTLDAL